MILKEAIHIAQSGTPGPVFVEIPIDILYSYKTVLKEMNIVKARSFKQVKIYLVMYFFKLILQVFKIKQNFHIHFFCCILMCEIQKKMKFFISS